MADLCLGIIETAGLAAAVETADTCLKSANVKLIGYELSNGGGMTVVKVEGAVGDVKAAVDAVISATTIADKIYGYKVIPRPSPGIELLVRNNNTIGWVSNESVDISTKNNELEETDTSNVDDKISINGDTEVKYTCNLCKDPACPRHKGELRSTCIRYKNANDIAQEE